MKIALRIWNYNIVGIEGLVDRAVQFVLEAPTINRFFYPAQQLEIETGFAELTKSNARSRVFANLSIVGGDLLQSLNDIVDIAAISDANGNPNTVLLRRPPRFVDYFAIADEAVWNRDFDIIASQQPCAA